MKPGTQVVLTGGPLPEYGVLAHQDGEDCWVVFFGFSPVDPGGALERAPYILRYHPTSLTRLGDFRDLEKRDAALEGRPWCVWPVCDQVRIVVRDNDPALLAHILDVELELYGTQFIEDVFMVNGGFPDRESVWAFIDGLRGGGMRTEVWAGRYSSAYGWGDPANAGLLTLDLRRNGTGERRDFTFPWGVVSEDMEAHRGVGLFIVATRYKDGVLVSTRVGFKPIKDQNMTIKKTPIEDFTAEYTRVLLATEWCPQQVHDGTFRVKEGQGAFFEYAQEKGWINKAGDKILSTGFKTAAAYHRR